MTTQSRPSIQPLRERIDALDHELVQLLAERQKVVREVIASKMEQNAQIRDLEREEALLKRIRDKALSAGLDPYFVEQLFREVILHSVRYQNYTLTDKQNDKHATKSVKVAYQGVEGAYSFLAAMHHFRERFEAVETFGFASFEECALAVEKGICDVAMLPIENTTAGSINETYDVLGQKLLHIVGEEIIRVEHCLLSIAPVRPENIRRIITHPLSMVQCSQFLGRYRHAVVESYGDSAMAALKVKTEGDLSQVAIASADAAERYGLHVLESGISNVTDNFTRFVVVASRSISCDLQLPCKTSLELITLHQKGALLQCLQVLDQFELNMTKLESRPKPGKVGQYRFYIDIEGNVQEGRVKRALSEMEKRAKALRVLGCYPMQVE